eukprot:TRINITY_DN9360_c4_g1_i1.p1 TRINITY_DN9360_c4_g1~~TRINITY_DN9360_c4_g1_i1.p1  ORF type:complete len:337 (+),score=94.54 TRINITY_DN9360_c4_g1_i1:29-1012(+)
MAGILALAKKRSQSTEWEEGSAVQGVTKKPKKEKASADAAWWAEDEWNEGAEWQADGREAEAWSSPSSEWVWNSDWECWVVTNTGAGEEWWTGGAGEEWSGEDWASSSSALPKPKKQKIVKLATNGVNEVRSKSKGKGKGGKGLPENAGTLLPDQSFSGIVRKQFATTGNFVIDCPPLKQNLGANPIIKEENNPMSARIGHVVCFKLQMPVSRPPVAIDIVINGIEKGAALSDDDDEDEEEEEEEETDAKGAKGAKGYGFKGVGSKGAAAKGKAAKGSGAKGFASKGEKSSWTKTGGAKGPAAKGAGAKGAAAKGKGSAGAPPWARS